MSNPLGSVTSALPAVLTVNEPSTGAVVAWGYNGFGQANVPGSALSGVIAASAGDYRTLALKSDGSVEAWGDTLWAWGDNSLGQLGIPSDLPPTRLGSANDWGSPP